MTVESMLILIFKCPKIYKDDVRIKRSFAPDIIKMKIRKGGLPDDEGRSGTVFILCDDDR